MKLGKLKKPTFAANGRTAWYELRDEHETTKENAGPEFEYPARSGCRCCQQPLQISRLPAECSLLLSRQMNNAQIRVYHI